MDLINDVVQDAFTKCNYSSEYGITTLSNRPDLCQYQCNGALAAAKVYKKAPIVIATEVSNVLTQSPYFKEVSCVMPGFINIILEDEFIINYINDMGCDPKYGCDELAKIRQSLLTTVVPM